MQIGPETIRAIVERPLSQSEIEGLLHGLNETEKAQLFIRMAEVVRRTSAVADIANRVSDSLSLDVSFPRLMEVVSDTLNADRSSLFQRGDIFRSTPPAPDWDGVWTVQSKY